MNKEERKAIEDMNRFANGIDMSCVTARQMQIILNLIEKQQKEIDLCEETEIALNNRIIDLEGINKEHQKLNGELRDEIKRQGNTREIEEKYIKKNFNIIRIYDEFKEE